MPISFSFLNLTDFCQLTGFTYDVVATRWVCVFAKTAALAIYALFQAVFYFSAFYLLLIWAFDFNWDVLSISFTKNTSLFFKQDSNSGSYYELQSFIILNSLCLWTIGLPLWCLFGILRKMKRATKRSVLHSLYYNLIQLKRLTIVYGISFFSFLINPAFFSLPRI